MSPQFRAALPYLIGAAVLVVVWAVRSRHARWANMDVGDFLLEYNPQIVIGLLVFAMACQVMACVAKMAGP